MSYPKTYAEGPNAPADYPGSRADSSERLDVRITDAILRIREANEQLNAMLDRVRPAPPANPLPGMQTAGIQTAPPLAQLVEVVFADSVETLNLIAALARFV